MSRAAAFVLAGTVPTALGAQQSVAAAPALVFDGVTVIDVEQGKRLPAQRVVITGNHIQAVGDARAVKLPAKAQVIDARGKFLIPGLWDLHTHSRRNVSFFYPLFIANGVTGIRDASSEVPLDTLLLWRREIWAGTRVGPPRQILSGNSIDEKPGCIRAQEFVHTCVELADSADVYRLVDSLKAAGADMLKTYELSRQTYLLVAAAARHAGIPFGGHLADKWWSKAAAEASDSGASIFDHVVSSGADLMAACWGSTANLEQCQAFAERFRRNGTWWMADLVPSGDGGVYAQRIGERGTAYARAFWADSMPTSDLHGVGRDRADSADSAVARSDAPGALSVAHRAGLPMLAGTDTELGAFPGLSPGFALHMELAMFAAEGLTPLEALQTATLNPAKMLHGTDSLGTVAPKKLADLVLLDADPLVDIANTTTIRAVVANGRYFDRVALDRLLVEARAKAKETP